MFERFTERARRVVLLAQEEAKRLNHSAVGTEHILLGIIREGEGVASKTLESLNISPGRLRAEIESAIGRGDRAPYEEVAFTPRAKSVLELALDEARRLGHNYIGTEHLLLGLIREGEGVAARVLEGMGADLERVRAQVVYLLGEDASGKELPFAYRTLTEFINQLATSDPTPGGGSASAVAGALGAALVAMLARLSTGRDGDDFLFTRTAEEMDKAWAVLLDLATEDTRVYDAVMEAMRMPRGTDEEKQARTRAVQRALREAADVPLRVAKKAMTVLEAAHEILPTANPNAVSDGGVAVLLSYAASHGAIANVRINLASIKDEEFRQGYTTRVDEIAERTTVLRDEGMAIVQKRLTR